MGARTGQELGIKEEGSDEASEGGRGSFNKLTSSSSNNVLTEASLGEDSITACLVGTSINMLTSSKSNKDVLDEASMDGCSSNDSMEESSFNKLTSSSSNIVLPEASLGCTHQYSDQQL